MGVGQNYYQDKLKDKTFSEILESEAQEIYTNQAALKLAVSWFSGKWRNKT